MNNYFVDIYHARPGYGTHVVFIEPHHLSTPLTAERLREVMAEAFKKAHPKWTLQKIVVEKET